jgi:hypothetical protein
MVMLKAARRSKEARLEIPLDYLVIELPFPTPFFVSVSTGLADF